MIIRKIITAAFIAMAVISVGCGKREPAVALTTEAYVWQPAARSEVRQAMAEIGPALDALVVHAAEIRWTGKDFRVERRTKQADLPANCGLVVRIGSSAAALDWTPEQIAPVAKLFKELALSRPREIQCDFDCPQKRLAGYRRLLDALSRAAGKIPVVPTVLPSWMEETDFPSLVHGRAGYVLQVHSLHLPRNSSDPARVFDPQGARRAAQTAARFRVPFRIAMATYGCEVWFDDRGKIIDVISEDSPPSVEPAARSFAFADPLASAALVREWRARPPTGLRGIIWYRLPVRGDRRNWPEQTFRKVINGECEPATVVTEYEINDGTTDVFLTNHGAIPAKLPSEIVIGNATIAGDGAGAYEFDSSSGEARLKLHSDVWPWLAPGEKSAAGWVRIANGGERPQFLIKP
ncbi:MAG: DUF3142 domain-containing protein [Verrucomicrobiota bacterium]